MAAKGATLVTLADVAKGANKQIGAVAEVLVQYNSALNDIPYREMNEGTIHKESIRSNLPEVYYRKANQAIAPSKTTTEERSFSGTQIDSKSQIDKDVANRGGPQNVGYERWNQAQGHIQSHAIELANLLVYGSPVDSHLKTPGLFDIYSTVDESAEETAKQVIDGGGTTSDNCSIFKVHWGERSVFGVYPKGTVAGLKRTDHSAGGKLVQIHGLTASGAAGTYWGYEEEFTSNHGLVVKDYRQAVRICNIDVAKLLSGVDAADLLDLMLSANYKIDSEENGQGVWYANRTVMAHLHKQAINKVGAGGGVTYENYQGQKVLMYLGCPIRRMDCLLNSEDRVV
jgi:hypothetical protein